MGEFGSTDGAGTECTDWSWSLLRLVALRPSLPAVGDCVHCAELARRQSRWDAGSRARTAEAAVRLLCGSHGGCSGDCGADVRTWPLRISALAYGYCDAGGVSSSFERE